MIIVGIYAAYLTIRAILPVALHYTVYVYTIDALYCWDSDILDWYLDFNNILCSVELALPVPVVIISCFVSVSIILSSINKTKQSTPGNAIKRKSTITILIVTIVYIIFNFPAFINFVFYSIVVVKSYPYPDPVFYNSTVMYYYSWNFTYVVCVALNSSINPVI